MPADKIDAAAGRVAEAERKATEARENAAKMADDIRQLVATCFERVTSMRHQSEDDAQRARAALAEARALLARAEKLTQ